ncbi:MAG: terpene cyclase/mutase family protein [Verrucomicrobiales bacterium]|nr:terpene cyclase/mutase family protein [Verrucomicrobiales bacterium]
MNYDPNQYQQQGYPPQQPGQGYDPNMGYGYDPNQGFAVDENGMPMEFATYVPRQKPSYWKRIGGGSLMLSLLIHIVFILIAIFLITFVIKTKKDDENVDFLPGGGGGGKSTEAKVASKRRAVSMSQPKSRIAANVTSSSVTLPDVQTMSADTTMTGLTMPTAGGVGGGEGGLRGKGKGGLLGDGYGKGVGPGHGVGFVGLPSIMRSRCSPQERMEKMRQNGGNEDCEKAVVKALDWFKSKQNADGSWGNQWKGGMTGLVLLCYYGHCETPESPFYGENILKGINYLINLAQQKNGFFTEMKTNHCVYEHGIACYALGETYSFSKLGKKEMPGLRESFERGVAIIIEHQQDDGNWAYGGNSPHYVKYGREDMSVTGWQFQALKAAKHTNLKITGLPASMRKAEQWLEGKLQADGGIGQHTEKGKAYGSHTMTGIGVLGIQTLGGNRGVANKGLRFLTEQFDKDPLDWNKNANIYCWYYNTQAFFQKGGREWEAWNKQFRDQLLKNQNPDGSYAAEQGDFNGATSAAAGSDSDIYRATLCTLMLEVYYRYLKVGDRGSDAGFGLQ